jgi:hypothetical protein
MREEERENINEIMKEERKGE